MAVTPNYGWPIPVATDYVKDGYDAIADLGNAIDTTVAGLSSGALTLVKTQVVGAGVTSVSVTNAFNSSFTNYQIILTDSVESSTYSELGLALNGITTNYYANLVYTSWGAPGQTVVRSGSIAYWNWVGAMTPNGGLLNVFVSNPNIAKYKTISARYNEVDSTRNVGYTDGFCGSNSTATGFTISAATGTLTGGTIRVYGYAN